MSTSTPSTSSYDAELDLLVLPATATLDEWRNRCVRIWQRSWRTLARIFLLTFAVPQVTTAVLIEQYASGLTGMAAGTVPLPTSEVPVDLGIDLLAIGLILLAMVATLVINAIGWAAGIWAITQDAVGLPVTAKEALAAGLYRTVPMAGNYLLYLLLVIVGALACLLPGLYVAVVGALFGFVLVYEPGQRSLIRSAVLVHRGLSVAASRILLLFGLALVVQCVVGMVSGLIGIAPTETNPGRPVLAATLDSLVGVPVSMALLVGLLLTYTQLRAREGPITTATLWAAANPQ